MAAIALVYANSLTGAFVFDDVPAIVENPTLRHPGDLGAILAPPGAEAGTVAGRPVLNLSLAFNYAVGGLRVGGYHVFNLTVHMAAALLLYGILRRAFRSAASAAASPEGEADGRWLAWAAALLWAVHPLQTEAVTYVVQRAESLMGLFYFAVLYAAIRGMEADRPGPWHGVAIGACLLGMGTKEVMVSAPVLVLLYDRTFAAGSFKSAWRQRRGLYLGLAATWPVLAVLVASTHGRGGSAGFAAPAGVIPYALTQGRAIATYLGLAFWPHPLVFDYGTALVRHVDEVGGSLVLVACLLVATGYGLWRRAPSGFLGAWFFAILAPSSSIVPIATEPLAEHRMYLPLAAVVVAAGAAVHQVLLRLWPRRAAAALGTLVGCAALGLGGATVVRNRVYESEIGLWTDTVAKVPNSARAHNNLGMAIEGGASLAPALAEFQAAVNADPTYAPAQYNLGVTLLDLGRTEAALPHLEQARSAPRHQAELQFFLGEAMAKLGRFAEAAEYDRKAFALAPHSVEAVFAWGGALAAQGRYAEAVEAFRSAVALAPDRARVRNNLANALLYAGRTDEAIAEYREALRRQPDDPSIRENLAQALRVRASASAGEPDSR